MRRGENLAQTREVLQIDKKELTVITKAKDLCGYVLMATEKSPKHFRFTLVCRMQNLALELIEHLYRANEVYMASANSAAHEKRLERQHNALTCVKLLAYMALIAREQSCILPKQYEQITKLTSDCQNLTGAWINSDRKRMQ